LVWLVGVIAVLFGRQHRFTVMALAAITLVNGATHIVAGLFTQSYNPGLLTSVILFLPLSLSYFYEILRHDAAARRLIAASLVWALLAHALMVGGLLAANLFGVIPESLYFLLLVLWSALPLMLFRKEINEQTRSQ
ncbi:MAG: HXXEE domain-containing protein, partial [Pseudomonadota bacterium]